MLGDSKHITLVLLFASCILLSPFYVQAQKTKTQLRKEKSEKQERIKEVESILKQTASKKKNTLGELQAMNHQILAQQALISTIGEELSILESEISETNMIIESLEDDLSRLKKEYSSMIYSAYKSGTGLSELTFLFSSSSFSELRSRIKYMEQYTEARKKQVLQIEKVKGVLTTQVVVIEAQRTDKKKLLDEEVNESNQLTQLKSKRNTILVSLESQEAKLRNDLDQNKKALSSLEKKITEIINAEIAAAAAASNKGSAVSVLSGSFEKNKTKFSWPVEGFVSQKFGRQNHAALKGVVVDNDGIGIQTKQNEMARAIYDGDVRVVFFVPTLGYSALIKHGDYFTVYGGLKEPKVKAGEKVTTGQIIGEVITKSEGVTELWFEIRKGRDPLNPEQWLARK